VGWRGAPEHPMPTELRKFNGVALKLFLCEPYVLCGSKKSGGLHALLF